MSPAYDLLATSIHLNSEAPLALDLFKDGVLSDSFEKLGFWAGSDFLELSRKWNLNFGRSMRWIKSFEDKHDQAMALDQKSFLSSDVKKDFERRWFDRVRALQVV